MPDPLTSAAAAKVGEKLSEGAIAKAKQLATRFRQREVAFIEDPETIKLVTDARKNPEYLLLQRFTKDGGKRALLRLGIILRQFETDASRIDRERRRVLGTHGLAGWHLAQGMEHGILTLLHEALLRLGVGEKALDAEMGAILQSVDRYVNFVTAGTDPGTETTIIAAKARLAFPLAFAVAGSGGAVSVAGETARGLSKVLVDYLPERHDRGTIKVAFIFSQKR